MNTEAHRRVVIEDVTPEVEEGEFPVKRIPGEKVVVRADIFADGHDRIRAVLYFRKQEEAVWQEQAMKLLVNDRYEAEFTVTETGVYLYTIQAWIDHFLTWQEDLRKKVAGGQDIGVELLTGIGFLETARESAAGADHGQLDKLLVTARSLSERYEQSAFAPGPGQGKAGDQPYAASLLFHEIGLDFFLSEELRQQVERYSTRERRSIYKRELTVYVERARALFSTWYEFFPRSAGAGPGQAFKACTALLKDIAAMGFDVLYLPPIHPIGFTARKGKNNSNQAGTSDPGSPWAIGSADGGHKAIHPDLGTPEDFAELVARAGQYGIELALDIALQCSPDHPYVREHPSWFKWRPDGTIQFAENPPKKYEDIIPFNFETDDWQDLWEELKSIFEFWLARGIHIFRVDNPHTKPFPFWRWLIQELKHQYPDVIFLAEAFSRPKVMKRLAKIGFSQSYTYFTWRNSKYELTEYLTELTQSAMAEYFRPNFWPNTPDILPEFLQYGGRPAFLIRLVLAATLSSSYGIYGPAFELLAGEALPGKEEYLDSEKYELKNWDRNKPGNLKEIISLINRIRHENPALHTFRNLEFYPINNDKLLFYERATPARDNVLLIAVNLDPFNTQSGWVRLPLARLGLAQDELFMVRDLISQDKFMWQGEYSYVELNPYTLPVHIFKVHRLLTRENNFDYFM